MHPFRTRFAKDIVTEFLPPVQLTRGRKIRNKLRGGKKSHQGDKVVIYCTGMPSVPSKPSVVKFFAKRGYWVFFPRYRGSWESGGKFLRISPEKDIKDVIDGIHRPFPDVFTEKYYRLKPEKIVLVGSSFGGPAALLSSEDRRISNVIALSPVVDWTDPSKEEPLGSFWKVVRDVFGEGYRFSKKDWDKLAKGTFYNPVAHMKKIDGRKILIVHAKDDRVIGFRAVQKFIEAIGAQSLFLPKGGHLASKALLQKRVKRKVDEFLKQSKRY